MGQETFETNDGGGSDGADQAMPAPVAGSREGPLSPDDLRQLELANTRAKKIHKAGGTAMVNGIILASCAGISALYAIGSGMLGRFSVPTTVMAGGLGLAAFNEFKGRRLLRGFDRRAPRLLGWNQLFLMALLIGYSAWMLADTYFGPRPYADEIARAPMLAEVLGPWGELQWQLTLALYGCVLVGAIVFQGLSAVYYFTRARHLSAYLDETPDWVVEVQRRTAGQ